MVRLETAAGLVPVRLEHEGPRVTFGWMLQPTPKIAAFEPRAALLAALGIADATLPIETYDNGPTHALVALPSSTSSRRVRV